VLSGKVSKFQGFGPMNDVGVDSVSGFTLKLLSGQPANTRGRNQQWFWPFASCLPVTEVISTENLSRATIRCAFARRTKEIEFRHSDHPVGSRGPCSRGRNSIDPQRTP
jgi:hypothetical protein